MYGGVEGEAGPGPGGAGGEDLPTPSLNCNMWASVQPYPRYGVQAVDGVPYQPFATHFTSSAPVVPHHSPTMQRPQPPPPDLVFGTQRALPPAPSYSSSTSSSSPPGVSSRDRVGHASLYHHRKPDSPLRTHRDFSSFPTQSPSTRDSAYQYQMGLSGVGAHWTDS